MTIITFQSATEKAIEKTLECLSSLGYRLVEVKNSKTIKQWNCLELESDYVSAKILMTRKRNGSINLEIKFDFNSKHFKQRGLVFDRVTSSLKGLITSRDYTRNSIIVTLGSNFYLN